MGSKKDMPPRPGRPSDSKKEVTIEELQELLMMRRRDVEAAFGRKKWREKKATQTFGTLLNLFYKDRPEILKKVDENTAIQSWKEVVGETAAGFSEAVKFRGNTLVVRVKDAIWMQQLALLKTTILRLYQKKFPSISLKDIYFIRY